LIFWKITGSEAAEKEDSSKVYSVIFPPVSSPPEALYELPVNKGRVKPEAVAVIQPDESEAVYTSSYIHRSGFETASTKLLLPIAGRSLHPSSLHTWSFRNKVRRRTGSEA
jgi:hypothetical protein